MKMIEFKEFLQLSKESTQNLNNTATVHVILGNESCDLDSMISSLALGYFHFKETYSSNLDVKVIPVLNIQSHELDVRTEQCYILKKYNIDPKNLVFRNDIDLKNLDANLSVSLVDHHILPAKDLFLAKYVIEIFDHRPLDTSANWSEENVKITIEQVGSCCTLIARKFMDSKAIIGNILAELLYAVITFDTIAFNPEAGRVKELDLIVSSQLEQNYSLKANVTEIFDELWNAHNDISHLQPKQLLYKDLKVVNGVPIPGLPMLVETFLKLSNALEDIKLFCEEHKSNTAVLIGLHVEQDADKTVLRDVAVYTENDENLSKIIIYNLLNAVQLKGYDFFFLEMQLNIPNVTYFKQTNVKLTRKQILPLVKDAVLEYSANKS